MSEYNVDDIDRCQRCLAKECACTEFKATDVYIDPAAPGYPDNYPPIIYPEDYHVEELSESEFQTWLKGVLS